LSAPSLKTFLRNNSPAILWGAFIVLLTSLPGDLLPVLPKFVDLLKPDKLVHIFMFLVFVFLLLHGFTRKGNPLLIERYAVLTGLVIAITIGGITELLQGLVIPMRVASPYDFIANVLGCFSGWGVFAFMRKKKPGWKNSPQG